MTMMNIDHSLRDRTWFSRTKSPVERAGIQVAGDAGIDEVRAAGLAYWRKQLAEGLPQPARGDLVGRDLTAAVEGINAYEGDSSVSVHHRLGRESEKDQDAIMAGVRAMRAAGQESASGAGERAQERDDRVEQRRAEHAVTDPAGVGQARADEARTEANLHADRARSHEARAAQLAARGFPVSTKDAVTAVAEKGQAARAGAAAAVEGGRHVARAGARSGAQQTPAQRAPGQRNRREPTAR